MSQDETRAPECVSDCLWREFENKSPSEHPFPESHIPMVLIDILMAGQETTTSTLSWACLDMAVYTDIQEKVYEELLREFPDMDTLITDADRDRCPFTQATINETQRWTPITYSSLDHTASTTVEDFHGYRIPKGTRIMTNLVVMYRDPKYWKYPDEFNPKNFLTDSGEYVKSPYLMPFAIGLRACPGEAIAKMEVFITFANIMRRFKITQVGNLGCMCPRPSILSSPPDYEVVLAKRQA